jgi:hypothetical protein
VYEGIRMTNECEEGWKDGGEERERRKEEEEKKE